MSEYQECPNCQRMQTTLYADTDREPICAWCMKDEARKEATLEERARIIKLAQYAETQMIQLTAGWLAAASNLVIEQGPMEFSGSGGNFKVSYPMVMKVGASDE